jgi:hypothetical protein
MSRSIPAQANQAPYSRVSCRSVSGDNVKISGFCAPDGSSAWKLQFQKDGLVERPPSTLFCSVSLLAGTVYYLANDGTIARLRCGQRLHVSVEQPLRLAAREPATVLLTEREARP